MLRVDRIKAAVDDVMTAAILGEGWEQALAGFSAASGAHGAVIMRNRSHRTVATLATKSIGSIVADFRSGRAPPSSRQIRASHGLKAGFRIDQDDYSREQLANDAYYQEFLRPAGYFWHANVRLVSSRDEWVTLSLKRKLASGPYERSDVTALDTVLPELRAAALFARTTLEAEARGMMHLLRRRGNAVFQIDSWGRVMPGAEVDQLSSASPIQVINRKFVSLDRAAQSGVDRAVAMALYSANGLGLARLVDGDGRHRILQCIAVPGRARDVFLATAALAVLIDGGEPSRIRLDAGAVAHAFSLTEREAAVTCLLAEGATIADVARGLGIEIGTVRVHLRSIFAKTGTNRQAELVALLGRLRP